MLLDEILSTYVIPLVGSVKFDWFDKNQYIQSIKKLEDEIVVEMDNMNSENLKRLLAYCIQEWPLDTEPPIDMLTFVSATLMIGLIEMGKDIGMFGAALKILESLNGVIPVDEIKTNKMIYDIKQKILLN